MEHGSGRDGRRFGPAGQVGVILEVFAGRPVRWTYGVAVAAGLLAIAVPTDPAARPPDAAVDAAPCRRSGHVPARSTAPAGSGAGGGSAGRPGRRHPAAPRAAPTAVAARAQRKAWSEACDQAAVRPAAHWR